MASMTALPPELVADIFGAVLLQDRLALSLVSRWCHFAAQKSIYETILLGQERDRRPLAERNTICFSLLLRTLLRRPDLSLMCKAVEMYIRADRYGDEPEEADLNVGAVEFTQVDLQMAQCLMRRMMPRAESHWSSELERHTPDCTLALLLCCLSKFQSLTLVLDAHPNLGLLDELLLHAASESRPLFLFQNLQTARYCCDVDAFDAGYIMPNITESRAFFQVEQIRTLSVTRIEDWTTSSDYLSQMPTLHALKCLKLEAQSCISANCLDVISQLTMNLEEFEYAFCAHSERLDPNRSFF